MKQKPLQAAVELKEAILFRLGWVTVPSAWEEPSVVLI